MTSQLIGPLPPMYASRNVFDPIVQYWVSRHRYPQINDLMSQIQHCESAESFTLLRKRLYKGIYQGTYVLRDFDTLFLSAERAIHAIAEKKGFEYNERSRAFRKN